MDRKYGRILLINLSDQTSIVMEIGEEVLRKYIGGAALAAHLYTELVKGDVSPLDPASPFFVMTGPLTGTSIMLAGRHGVAGRSPLTGFWGEASVGGHWGREFRRTGFDGLVLLGKARRPTYLFLRGEQLEFRDASHLWGMDTFETDAALSRELTEKVQVCSIGPAGEKQVKFAGIFTDGSHARTAARCGLGALLGSKMVKAIVVAGTSEIPVADRNALGRSIKKAMPDFVGRMQGTREFGTPGILMPGVAMGDVPIKNWTLGAWTGEHFERINAQVLNAKYLKKRFHCASCPVGCGRVVGGMIDPSLQEIGGPEYETLAMLGSNCLIDNLQAILRLNELVNRLGLDSIETGAVISFCMELYENGLIGETELGPQGLKWGDSEATEKLIRKIALREGFGDLLAEGLKVAAAKIGGMAEEYAIHSNNMALPAHDPRAYASIALGYATSSRGACHTNSFSHIYERWAMWPEIGFTEVWDRFKSAGKEELVIKMQNIGNLWENLALCKFTFFGAITLRHVSEWLNTVLDWDMDKDALMEVGERSVNLKRKLNVKWGLSRKNDTLPLRVITHRTSDGGAGNHLPAFNIMLADYYEARGWSKEGIPTEATLKRLGL